MQPTAGGGSRLLGLLHLSSGFVPPDPRPHSPGSDAQVCRDSGSQADRPPRVTWNKSLALQSLGGKTRCPPAPTGGEKPEHMRDGRMAAAAAESGSQLGRSPGVPGISGAAPENEHRNLSLPAWVRESPRAVEGPARALHTIGALGPSAAASMVGGVAGCTLLGPPPIFWAWAWWGWAEEGVWAPSWGWCPPGGSWMTVVAGQCAGRMPSPGWCSSSRAERPGFPWLQRERLWTSAKPAPGHLHGTEKTLKHQGGGRSRGSGHLTCAEHGAALPSRLHGEWRPTGENGLKCLF